MAKKPAKKKDTSEKKEKDERPAFIRLGEKRVSKALNDLRLVKNLARYPHKPEQGVRIVATLQEAIESIEQSFSEIPSKKEKPSFTFTD